MNELVGRRYVSKTVQITGDRNEAVPVSFITLVDENGLPVSVTHLQDYVSDGPSPLGPLRATTGKLSCFFCGMCNYIFFEKRDEFHVSSFQEVTKPMMEEYFQYYASGTDLSGKMRTPDTVEKVISVCTFTMVNLSKDYAGMQVNEENLLKWHSTLDWRKQPVTIQVPDFDITGGMLKQPLLRDITPEAFEILLSLAFQYAPDIAFGICLQAFAGLRAGEVCNIHRGSSLYEPSISTETMIAQGDDSSPKSLQVPVIDLTREVVLRSDNVSVGRIKKERYQQVHPAFLPVYDRALAFHLNYLKGCRCEEQYAPMFVNKRGMAMTYDDYEGRFTALVTDHFVPELLKHSSGELRDYGMLVQKRGLSTHVGRHFFTLMLVLLGMSPEQMKSWRGDTSIESAMTYWASKGVLNQISMRTGKEFLEKMIALGGLTNE